MGGVRSSKASNRAPGSGAGPQLENLPEQDQHGDDRGRLEVNRNHAMAGSEGLGKEAGRQGRHHAVKISNSGSQADQGEHVEAAVDDRTPAALEERPAAVKDDGRGEHELNEAHETAGRPAF